MHHAHAHRVLVVHALGHQGNACARALEHNEGVDLVRAARNIDEELRRNDLVAHNLAAHAYARAIGRDQAVDVKRKQFVRNQGERAPRADERVVPTLAQGVERLGHSRARNRCGHRSVNIGSWLIPDNRAIHIKEKSHRLLRHAQPPPISVLAHAV